MNLERSQKRINYLMSLFVTQIKGCTAMGQTDLNKVAENILIPIIAEVYGYRNLENFNFTKGSNFPSVDLGDETAKVVFQITATPTLDKVKDTLRKFIEHKDKLYEKYDKLIIYILTEKQNSYSDTEINKIINGKFSFDTQKDIWDWRNILGEVTKFPIEKTREVEKILEANLDEERREPDWEVVDKVEQIINESTELFVGRSEEFLKLDNFLADNSSGVMLVTAGAGFGKTSLLANWVKERQGNGCFIADHFFSQQYDKTRSVKSAYWNLLRQIYRYYELYYEQLPNELDELRKRLYNILKERGAREDKPLVIVIDGLDEIDAADIPFSLPFFTSLPQNVFVIASARAELGEEPKYLENWSERSQKLHLDYLPRCAIADWLKQTGDGELAVFAEDSNFVAKLDEITKGFPLYLSYLIDELSQAVKQKQDIRQLLEQTPKGFENYVKHQLKRLEALDLPDERWQFFALLAVAKGVLEKQDIKAITGMRDRSLRQLHQCWQVTRWMRISEDKFYAFAHPLLGTTFAIQLGDDAEDALEKLINYCSHWQEKSIPYALRYYAEHLRDVKHWEELYAIARNEDFYSHSIEQFPDEPNLSLKTVQTALLAAAEEDKAGEMAEFMLLHARRLLQTTAQDSPLDALRKGYLERAWKLTDLYEIEYRILWYLLLAWELKDTGKFEEARETLKRLQQQELPRLSTNGVKEWQSESAAYLLAHVFEVSEDICTSLEQKLFDDRYRCILCGNLSNRGNFAAALKTVQGVSSQILWQVSVLLNIAKAQVQKGDIEYSATFTNALEIVKTLVSTSWWEILIGKIAKAQIEVGNRASAQATLTEALETADKIDNPLHQVRAFVSLANVQAEVGMVEEAIATLQKINDRPELEKLFLSISIAKVWFKTGNKDKIKAIFARQLEIANGIANEEKQADTLRNIVIAQAELGEFADARETAKKIDCSDRPYALMRIATEQAKVREFTTALETVEEIEIKHYQSEALSVIATSQAEARNFPDAFETASRIEEPFKAQALCGIAIAKAEASPFTNDALEIAEQIESNRERTQALVGIVRIQGQVKNFPDLLKIKDKVRGKDWKNEVLSAMAEVYAKAEDFTTALEIATEIDIPSMHAKTLEVIAEIQAQAGQFEAARNTFATFLKIEKKPEASISFMRASALARVAEVQVKNAQKEVGATTARIACEIAQNIDNPAEKTNLLARIVQILVEAEKIEEAKYICDRACEIAQQISNNREDQRSQSFGLIAQAQARVGEFDVALRTLEAIRIPYFYVDALRSITQLQVEADPQQIEKWKIALNKADEYYKSGDPLSFEFLNMLKALTIIAVARSTVGETEAALATFADLLESVKTQKQRERDKDLSTIAIGYAEVGKFPAAIEIINEIEDGAHKISALWAIAWEQFKKGKQVTTLDIALAAKEKIEDEKKRLQALKRIAQIQAIAGQGEEAVRTVEAIITDRNKHLPDIALLFAETGDRVNFKHLLIPCADYLDAAYQMCGYLARLYPEQASAVAKVLSELNGKER
ncbi:SMEK domain-containing protein [Microcoleus sp. herbarium7]|uniref:SMEK domain-containing protein n=1 Tax=Microcoleus sp. herbarium7 TaxID=3055435 RepID=UPI002FD5500D